MRTSVRLALSALAASMLLALALSTASAGRISTSNQNLRMTWRTLEFNAAEVVIRCPVTLETSFHTRTIAKVARALVGGLYTARSNQERCTNGTVAMFNGTERYNGTTTPNTLQWHLTYLGFGGTLPNIGFLLWLIERFRFGVRDSSGLCTGQYGTAEDRVGIQLNIIGGSVGEATPVEGQNRVRLSRRDAGIVCPSEGAMTGSGSVTLQGNTTRVTFTLI